MVVMFSITRNLYEYAPGIIQNLVDTNPSVKKIYLFIEDNEFPYPLNPRVITLNINNIPPLVKDDNPNKGNIWTKMAYTRCFIPKIIADEKIIYCDLDLIFYNGLERLWNIDFEGDYICAVEETSSCARRNPLPFPTPDRYINSGVLLMDLRAMRRDGIDLKICDLINGYKLNFPDQDAINTICNGRVKYISPSFNASKTTTGDPMGIPLTICHCSQIKPWDKRSPYYNKWKLNNDKALGISN